ncbi:sensor histidine kinase [Variovorax ginsengisoli]|uniref:Signal transduction histidine kinase n=1 Tax=Variovorax ginsengisoli TaxID=363844 RepID=A0ABT9SA78_9BURK|nr:ATP-binding protein [Variovorax ginsengisoli]MDP9901272.1 signal transduction histidine kinase [Variovorax ginsengisoli]
MASAPTVLPLDHAQWVAVAGQGLSVPPPTFDANEPPRDQWNWQDTALPSGQAAEPGTPARLPQAHTPHDAQTENETQTTWFRIAVPPVAFAAGKLALYVPHIATDGTVAVYVDGQLVHRAQPQGMLWNSSRKPLWISLGGPSNPTIPREIVIRLEHTLGTQVTLSPLQLGLASALHWRYSWRQWVQQDLPAMFSAFFLAIGLFSLMVWLHRRHDKSYLLFFVLSVLCFIRGLHFYVDMQVGDDWFSWLTLNSIFWLLTAIHLSLGLLHRQRRTWLTLATLAATAVIGLVTLPLEANPMLPLSPGTMAGVFRTALVLSLLVGVAGMRGAWRRSGEAMLVAAGFTVCIFMGALDWVLQSNFRHPQSWAAGVDNPTLGFAVLGFLVNSVLTFSVFGVLITRRYVGAMSKVEQANTRLAERLNERETALAQSYALLREAEQRQTISQERQRLMQDMHDGLGSSLVTALRVVENDQGRHDAAYVAEVLKGCIDDLKLTIDSMEPVEADLLLLLATLRYRLSPRLERAGIALHWDIADLPRLDWLDPRSALHILRTLQEAFTNILKHARATTIRVATGVENGGVTVTVADNGQGFDVHRALHGGGMGLANQQRRAAALGGQVRWKSGPDGSRMTLWLPIERTGA